MALSEFEKKRQENIRRNKELLSKLNLDSISTKISREIERKSASPQPTRKRPSRSGAPLRVSKRNKTEVAPPLPARRSRRIAGIQSAEDDPEGYAKHREEEEAKARRKREYEELKRTKLFGDFSLIDLITDKRKGEMLFEDKVRNRVKEEKENEQGEEGEEEEENGAKQSSDEAEEITEQENKVLHLLQSLGDKFSAGDFYEQIKNSKSTQSRSIDAKRSEFEKLRIFPEFDPLEVKLTHNRITSIMFHPSTRDRVVAAGDTNGNVGIWAPDFNSKEPTISIMRPHGRNISKIITPKSHLEKIYTASYDGSIRSLDLNKLTTSEVLSISEEEHGGISDINLVREDPNLLYLSTLEGEFLTHDLRMSSSSKRTKFLRLHDKKIGGFAVNPNNSYQIASASLDRTLRLWDLRKVDRSEYSEYAQQKSPHMYGNYTSRLSVSTVDWNLDNHLVCNGYDDQICIFDYSKPPIITKWSDTYMPDYKPTRNGSSKNDDIELPENLTPVNRIKHNCQTGRWVSILKARWQENPADGVQKFIIGNMKRGMDVYDQNGVLLAHLDDEINAVPAVCSLHPTQNWAVGGSASGKIYLLQ
ncbi:uncharacterized protein LODBEIA_P58160 [Lodderomyces beijingensis]|uniref:DNA damage-binding protein CMR1 n=1 Tax=Lodderomyces beijingensis TaxID=1775926 RepID=A0ABP0ZTZ0_9ASCO